MGGKSDSLSPGIALKEFIAMDLLTEPVSAKTHRSTEPLSASDWMDSFATGACDRETFLRGVGGLLGRAPDTGWELLALIDQYYRRRKIDAATFMSLKTYLQNLLMGRTGDGEFSLPLAEPTPAPRASAPATPAPALQRAHAHSVADDEPHAERVLKVGDVLRGRYRIIALLGHGGMGTVFEAIDQYRLDRSDGDQRVAIKVLHTAVIQRPGLFAELRREFQHLQSLTHPNIVRVHEFDRDGDLAFFTMEYLSGMLLTRVVAAHGSAPLHRPHAHTIVREVGAAVMHAHARGVVHGDLNPGNIFITDSGEVRVLDFGAAHQLRRTPWISDFEAAPQIAVATPRFASCQLLEGETADARDDVYALANIAYVLLTGVHPYRDMSALKARTLRLKPVRPVGIARHQWNALRAGLEFERDRRPTDMQAWLRELASDTALPRLPELPALLVARGSRRRNDRWMATAAVIALVAVGGWWTATRPPDWRRAMAEVSAKFKQKLSDIVPGRRRDGARPTAAAVTTGTATAAQPPAALPPVTSGPVTSRPAMSRPAAAPAAPGANLPHARIELAQDDVDVPASESVAHVLVHRSRTMRGDVSFSWWTESGTAKPWRDFTPVKSTVEHIADGRNTADLIIPVAADPARRDPRSFYIVIDEASGNAALGPRTLTMVTLSGTD
jgi:hypothetical protein